jgi:small neutral amino acid transporter SnatA (MarC family)
MTPSPALVVTLFVVVDAILLVLIGLALRDHLRAHRRRRPQP